MLIMYKTCNICGCLIKMNSLEKIIHKITKSNKSKYNTQDYRVSKIKEEIDKQSQKALDEEISNFHICEDCIQKIYKIKDDVALENAIVTALYDKLFDKYNDDTYMQIAYLDGVQDVISYLKKYRFKNS